MLGAKKLRAAGLLSPPVEAPEREATPAATGHPMSFYVEPILQLALELEARGFKSEHGDTMHII